MKEFYHVGQQNQKPTDLNSPLNIWPKEVPELKDICITMYRIFEEIGQTLLKAIVLYLNL